MRSRAGVRFGILGPLEVTVDGVALAVGGPKPRALLAALLLHPGVVVSTDRLSAAVWGEDPPHDALGTLRAYVSRLRAALEPLPQGERLAYRAPGYVLTVGDDELDAARFARLVDAVRGCSASGDHHRAVDLLDSGLALWRGGALAEFDLVPLDADAEVARLEELRLVALELRAEALLALGRGAEVVPEIEGLVARLPGREPLAVLLMRALYASGRQSDALTVYRDLRRRLRDELGVDPAATTQLVHRRLLEQDPTLLPAPRREQGNLPHRGSSFVGRQTELEQVAAALERAPVLTLTGVGGVGKSRLALQVAAAVRERFADGVWSCELAPLADGDGIGYTVAAALRVQQRHGLSIEETIVQYLRGRRTLLLLDNCEHVLVSAGRLADRLVAECPGVVVLATSREPLGVGGEQVWPVPPLRQADGVTLFVQRARATRPDYRPGPAAARRAAEICRRLDGLPLAIELAAARMRVMNEGELAERLDDRRLLTDGTSRAQPRHQSLDAAIEWSYRLLTEQEQTLFVRLSVFASGADLVAVHAVCGERGADEADTLDLLAALVDKSMVVPVDTPSGTRYRLLETLRAFGRARLSGEAALARRDAEYYAGLAVRAARELQGPDEKAWVQRALPDADNLRAAFEHAMLDQDVDLALRLSASLPEVLQMRFGFEAAGWAERALGLAPPDHPLFPAAVGAAARGAWNVGDFDHALDLVARAAGRSPGRGTARSGYPEDVEADVGLYRGHVEPALRHYSAVAAAARRDADPIRLVWALYYVAVCHAVRRTPELGLPAATECLQLATGTDNPSAMSLARYALGLVLKKSDPAAALPLLDEAATGAASVNNFWWEGIALMEAASTRAVHGDPEEAGRAFLVVLDHWDRVGDWTQQWLNLRYIVRLLVRGGAGEEALTLHRCLLAAGKPSPLDAARAARLLDGPDGPAWTGAAARGDALSGAEAVLLARSALLAL